MNGLLILAGIILLVCVIAGLVRGFIKIVASLAATIIIIVLVVFLTPYVSKGILKVTPLETMVQEKCVESLTPDLEDMDLSGIEINGQKLDGIDLEAAGITEEDIKNLIGKIDLTREQQISAIENANIPQLFRDLLLENNNAEIYKNLGVSTFGEYVGAYMAKVIADFVGFLLTLLIVTIVVRTIVYMLGLISDLPVIGGLNRIAGGVLGMATGVIIIWLILIVVTLLYTTSIGKICFENIADSQILTFLYDHNPLLEAITRFR